MNASDEAGFIPSSALRPVLHLLDKFVQLRQVVGPVIRPCLVLDTNFILQDLQYVVKNLRDKTGDPALLEVLKSGVATVIAPNTLNAEVRSHFKEFAHRHRLSEQVFEDLWAKYLPHIKFCSASALPIVLDPDTRRLQGRDPTDVPFSSTFAAVGADAIITKDPDYKVTRLPVAGLSVVMDLRTYARHKTVELHFMMEGFVVTSFALAGIWAAVEVGKAIVNFVARLPGIVQFGLALGGIAVVVNPRLREQVLGWARPFVPMIRDRVCSSLDRMTLAAGAKVEADAAEKKLVAAIPRRRRTLRQAVVAVLVEAGQPLGEDEIALRVVRSGYSTKSPTFRAYLRRILLRDARFRPVPSPTSPAWAISALAEPRRAQ